jgi:hemerythrin
MFNHVTGNHPQERDYFNRAIKEIVNYVKTHFTTEEKILRATNYPDYAEHKKEHDSFIHAIIENSKDYNSGGRHTLSTLIRFLRDWVLSHIAIMDKHYVEYMKKTARLKDDGTLVIDVKGD